LVTRLASSILVLLIAIILAPSLHAQRRRPSDPKPGPPPTHTPPPVTPAAGDPLAGLTAAQREAFADGLEDFSDEEEVGDGLGPVFNERSCKACHSVPAIGGGSERTVTRFSRRLNGAFDPLANLGGSLMQDHAIGPQDGSPHTFLPESVPAVANLVVHRRSPPLFGLGLVDATPDADFISLAAMQSARRDPVAGRVSQVMNIRVGMTTIGKFGWKAQVPSIFQFAGDAYVNELGITSPDFPNESCPQGNCAELTAYNPFPGLNDDGGGPDLLANFMTLLAAPPRGPQNRDTDDGEKTFENIGCAACHVATFRSGSSSIAALDHKTYHPYSDFLLHDMGSLGDGLEMGSAKGAEMRTAPLWGLRFFTTFLHDGRATTLDQAILAHDGQARGARDHFAALTPGAKAKLMAFLQSL
jgi:CxxC motif-containing protein (DUF1111 family)